MQLFKPSGNLSCLLSFSPVEFRLWGGLPPRSKTVSQIPMTSKASLQGTRCCMRWCAMFHCWKLRVRGRDEVDAVLHCRLTLSVGRRPNHSRLRLQSRVNTTSARVRSVRYHLPRHHSHRVGLRSVRLVGLPDRFKRACASGRVDCYAQVCIWCPFAEA